MNRIFSLSILCCLFVFYSNAQVAQKKIMMSVKSGQFTIGKVVVTKKWSLASVLPVFDKKNDRRKAGYNTLHTFDQQGVVLFEKNDNQKLPTDTISEVQIYFGFRKSDTSAIIPKQYFAGVLQIENLKISGNETPGMVKEMLYQYIDTDSYQAHTIRLSYKGIYIYFLFTDEEDKLLKISIGKDNRKY